MKMTSSELGTLIETNEFVVLFGNRYSQFSALQSHFPEMNFKRIKQVHKDRVVHTSPHSIDFSHEADSHYTSDRGLGLCIATADCIPVLIYNDHPRWICSIHAGWRGVENKIVPKSIAALKRIGCSPANLKFFVGPHIQKSSFEVGNDVRDLLLKTVSQAEATLWEPLSPQKSKVDLHAILKGQIVSAGSLLENCYFEFKDTVTDLNYHSFRRDRDNSGRQLSFIALKK